MTSPYGLDHTSFTSIGGYEFNVNASAGFTEIYTLQMKLAKSSREEKVINRSSYYYRLY